MRKNLVTALALTSALGLAGCSRDSDAQLNRYEYSNTTMNSFRFPVKDGFKSVDYQKVGDSLYIVMGFLEGIKDGITYSTPIPKELQGDIAEQINANNGTEGIRCEFPVGKKLF